MRRERRAAVDLPGRVDAVREAVEVGGDRFSPDVVQRAQEVLARAGERMRLGAEHTVVALAGATGSGKSSLFNALARLEVAQVGARRPTTSTTTSCVWGDGADPLLDWLGVSRRHRTNRESALDADDQADLRGLVLLDLPDHDSTEVDHRLEVDRLTGVVDLLVWVVDPQKYADEALHQRYLRRMTGHEGVMVVVLNQADRIPGDVDTVRGHLEQLLADDGLGQVRVVTTSARTGAGVDELRSAVLESVQARDAAVRRLAADLDDVAAALAAELGGSEADPDRLEGGGQVVDALASAAGVPAVLDAVESGYRRDAHGSVGWPFTRWVRSFRPDPMSRLRLGKVGDDLRALTRSSLPEPTQAQRAQVDLARRRVVDSASEGLTPRWSDAVREAASAPDHDLSDALDQAVTGVELETRRPLWWSVVGGVQMFLALAAVVGGLWLVALAVVAWLQLPDPPLPRVGEVPLPTLLLVGGLLLGLLLAVVGRAVARWAARRRRQRTERRLRHAVTAVARSQVLDPVAQVLTDHRRVRRLLQG